MNWDDIYTRVNQWYNTGSLLDSDKPILQAAYTELTGDTGERCRRCESYWSDVQHTLRYHLIKELGYQAMDNKNKYMIREEAGFLQVHGLPYAYINKGKAPETESAKHLTDDVAERLLAENPERSSIIVPNPNYEEKAAKDSGQTTKQGATKSAAKSATKAKAEKKPAATKPEAPATKPEDAPPVETTPANPESSTTPDSTTGNSSEQNV